jgi:hypothetical protein
MSNTKWNKEPIQKTYETGWHLACDYLEQEQLLFIHYDQAIVLEALIAGLIEEGPDSDYDAGFMEAIHAFACAAVEIHEDWINRRIAEVNQRGENQLPPLGVTMH